MKQIIPAAESVVRSISRGACIIGGWSVILLSIGICVEVVLRKVFSTSLQGIDEYGGYTLAVTASLGMAYCFCENAHIQIDVLVRRLPRKLARALACVAIAVLGLVVWIILFEAYRLTRESFDFGAFSNTPLRTPIGYPQAIWTGGFGLFLIAIILRLLHIAQSILTGDNARTAELLGETSTGELGKLPKVRGLE